MANWADPQLNLTQIRPFYIEATIVGENPFAQAKDNDKSRREKTLQRRRDDQLAYQRQLAQWEKERKQIKQQPKPEVEETPPAVVVQETKEPDSEKLRAEFEQGLNLAIVAEQGNNIPPNATLLFDVELLDIR